MKGYADAYIGLGDRRLTPRVRLISLTYDVPCLSVSFMRRHGHGTCPPVRLQPDYLKLHPIHVHPLFDPDGHQEGRRVWRTSWSKITQWVTSQVSTTYLLPISISIYRFSAHWHFPSYVHRRHMHAVGRYVAILIYPHLVLLAWIVIVFDPTKGFWIYI